LGNDYGPVVLARMAGDARGCPAPAFDDAM